MMRTKLETAFSVSVAYVLTVYLALFELVSILISNET